MTHLLQQHRTTIFFILGLLLLSTAVHYGRINASFGGVELSSDVPTYTTIAAANTYPEAFVNDPVYDKKERYNVHSTIITSIIPLFEEGGNFGLAYLSLTGVQFFLHGLAFYLLGMFLMRSPWQAVFFALVMSQAYWMPFGTYWGNGYTDYLPRSTFEIFYALFIMAALYIRNIPKLWPLFMMGMGLLAYVHSISTLPTAFGFWLGFAICRPQNTSIKKHCIWLIFCGLCFMAVISPIIFNFLRSSITLSKEDVDLFREVLSLRYNIEFTHYWTALKEFLIQYTLYSLFPFALVVFWGTMKLGSAEDKALMKQFTMWIFGVIFCVILYLIDQETGFPLDRKPFEFDLVRVIRFLVFISICICCVGFNVVCKHFEKVYVQYKKHIHITHVLLFTVLFLTGYPHKLLTSIGWYWNSANHTRYEEAYAPTIQNAAIINAIKEHTKKGSLIFDPNGDRAIRYVALRSLVYSWFDCSLYYYSKDVQSLKTWYNTQKDLKSSPTAYMDIAKESGADYLISHRPEDKEALQSIGRIVWENPKAIIVQLNKK